MQHMYRISPSKYLTKRVQMLPEFQWLCEYRRQVPRPPPTPRLVAPNRGAQAAVAPSGGGAAHATKREPIRDPRVATAATRRRTR